MSPNRLIVVAACVGALAVAAPYFAPSLLTRLIGPPASEKAAATPARAPASPPPARDDNSAPVMVQRLSGLTVALRADRQGHFQGDAVVNGRTIPVVVDTGATTVALNGAAARRLGLYLSQSDYRIAVSTANGVVAAAPVRLGEVRLGNVSVRNVEAVVVSGDALPVNLLGMTFLSRLSKFEIADGQLVLTQ